MSNKPSSTWFADAPGGWTGVPNFVRDAAKQKQISHLAVLVALHLCGVADNRSGEVIAQSMSYIAEELGTYPSNVSDCIKQLEKINFLLRDSGATGRILNRYKLFNDPLNFDANYIFTKESRATNRAAIQGKGKKAGTTATPMPKKNDFSPMLLNLEYCEEVLKHIFLAETSGLTSVCVPDPSNPDMRLIPVDKDEFNELKDAADLYGYPFPFKYEPGKKWTCSDINHPGFARAKQ